MDASRFLSIENCRIRFTTKEGDYEGIVTRFAPEIEVLFVKSVIWLPKNTKMGILTFRAREISAYEIIERLEVSKTTNYHFCAQKYYRDTKEYTLADDDFDDNSSMHDSEMFEEEEKEYEFKLPPSLADVLPLDNVVIDCLDQEFHDSICHLKKQDVIGVSLESPRINRFEKLHWLCISTQSCTFLFDLQTLGKDVFSEGLKCVLEDPKIEKVLHDCREACDCLYHQYDTKLVNVFDTQVADYVINQQRQRKGKGTSYVNSLNSCLSTHLDIPDEFLHRRKKRSYQDDLVFYGLRPVSDEFRDFFTKNVIYLRRLKQEVDLLLLEPFHHCVDVYLKSLQKKTNREFNLGAFDVDKVPDELLAEGIQVLRFKEHEDIPAVVSSGPPFRESKNSFKQFVDYCDKIQNGDICDVYVTPLQKVLIAPDESNCVKDNCCTQPGTGVPEPFGKGSSSDSSSLPTDSTGKDSRQNKLSDKSQENDEDDPWVNFRRVYAETGPTVEGRKLVFVPAGKQC